MVHWRAGCLESAQVRFGGGQLETCTTVHSARRETPRRPARRWLPTLLRVRHEGVAATVLLFREGVTTPAVLPAVSSRGVRPWQRGGAKPSAQRILTRRGGRRGVSRSGDCQHQGGWGPGGVVGSTPVNRRQRRHEEQAQGAARPGPKGRWPGPGVPNSPGADDAPPAPRRDLTHAGCGDATW
jgi:hypothetical protein